MNWKRRVELILGLVTVSLALWAAATGLADDYDVALRLQKPYAWPRKLLVYSIFLVLPGLAVAIGSYAHAARDRVWGVVLIVLGALILSWQFRLLFASGIYVLIPWMAVLLLMATTALLTVIASFVTANSNDR